jgi:hypothetical protein
MLSTRICIYFTENVAEMHLQRFVCIALGFLTEECPTFVEVAQRLRETGLIQPSMRGRGPQRSNRVLNVEEQILHVTEKNPGLSTRQLARQCNVSQWVVFRTLHEQLLYLYQFIMYKEFKD